MLARPRPRRGAVASADALRASTRAHRAPFDGPDLAPLLACAANVPPSPDGCGGGRCFVSCAWRAVCGAPPPTHLAGPRCSVLCLLGRATRPTKKKGARGGRKHGSERSETDRGSRFVVCPAPQDNQRPQQPTEKTRLLQDVLEPGDLSINGGARCAPLPRGAITPGCRRPAPLGPPPRVATPFRVGCGAPAGRVWPPASSGTARALPPLASRPRPHIRPRAQNHTPTTPPHSLSRTHTHTHVHQKKILQGDGVGGRTRRPRHAG